MTDKQFVKMIFPEATCAQLGLERVEGEYYIYYYIYYHNHHHERIQQWSTGIENTPRAAWKEARKQLTSAINDNLEQ